jgi:hypothetical protein
MKTNLVDFWVQYIEGFFKKYIFGDMYNDIETAMQGGTKHLVVLGLLIYVEVLGGFVTGLLGVEGRGRTRFESFLFHYMGTKYKDEENQGGLDIYDEVRCGLVHLYFTKRPPYVTGASITRYEYEGCRCGVNIEHVVRDGVKERAVIIVVERLFLDFKAGVDKYYKQLVIDRNEELISKFAQALGETFSLSKKSKALKALISESKGKSPN